MKRIILLATLILSACQATVPTSKSQTAELTTSTQAESTVNQKAQSEMSITSKGIGKAKLGMTLRELKKISTKDTDFEVIPSFLDDVDAIAVTKKGIVQYYILYDLENSSESDLTVALEDRVIRALVTDNDNYQTKSGIKVGTLIQKAEEIYGNAILTYNTAGESREYITFGNENPNNIKFRASYFKLISDGMGYSGIYPEYPGVSYTTDKYHNDAAIAAIEVVCDSDDCTN